MDIEKKTHETPKQQAFKKHGSDSDADQSLLERGAEAFGSAEKAVGDAYDKTTQKVSETYGQAKSYGSDNPGNPLCVAKQLQQSNQWLPLPEDSVPGSA